MPDSYLIRTTTSSVEYMERRELFPAVSLFLVRGLAKWGGMGFNFETFKI